MASRNDIRTLLREIFSGANVGSTVFLSLEDLALKLDFGIRSIAKVTHVLQDQLGLMELGENEFTGCQYEYIRGGKSKLANSTLLIDNAIATHSIKVGRLYDLDLRGAGMESTGLDSLQVAARLRKLADRGQIRLYPRDWLIKARIVQCPSSECGPDSISFITDQVYEEQLRDWEFYVRGQQQIVELFTKNRCTTVGIAEYFGTEIPGGRTRCERCSWCLTGRPLEFKYHQRDEKIDTEKVRAVLETIQDRDHPRFLAHVAAGIASPRVRHRNLQVSPVFRSLRHAILM